MTIKAEAPNGTCSHSCLWMKSEESGHNWEIYKLYFITLEKQ